MLQATAAEKSYVLNTPKSEFKTQIRLNVGNQSDHSPLFFFVKEERKKIEKEKKPRINKHVIMFN